MSEFRLVLVTNLWNHYQGALCFELARLCGPDRFKLVLTERLPEERRALKWADPPEHDWIVRGHAGSASETVARATVLGAPVAVFGSAPFEWVAKRASSGAPTMIMRERLWKQPWRLRSLCNPRAALSVLRFRNVANRPNVHYLAIGSGAPGDAMLVGAFGDRVWEWSYFADVAFEAPKERAPGGLRVLWVGRMLEWKRVDVLLRAVARLASCSAFDRVDIVGTGEAEGYLRQLAGTLELGERCRFHSPQDPATIRGMMRESDVYVLPSDRNEGWGVVVNEAMSEGTVVVANREAGAATVMLRDNVTGFLFDDGNVEQLSAILRRLSAAPDLRRAVRGRAYQDVRALWHPAVGAKRLIALARGISGYGDLPSFTTGPGRRCVVPPPSPCRRDGS